MIRNWWNISKYEPIYRIGVQVVWRTVNAKMVSDQEQHVRRLSTRRLSAANCLFWDMQSNLYLRSLVFFVVTRHSADQTLYIKLCRVGWATKYRGQILLQLQFASYCDTSSQVYPLCWPAFEQSFDSMLAFFFETQTRRLSQPARTNTWSFEAKILLHFFLKGMLSLQKLYKTDKLVAWRHSRSIDSHHITLEGHCMLIE